LSHSSTNDAEAIAVQDWLVKQGWNEVFLDLDPERGLKAGQRWQDELKKAAERCEVVIFLISPAWVNSKWCLAEFLLAKQLGKTIFGVIVDPTPPADIPTEMTAEWQLVDLTAGELDHSVTVTLPRGAGTATGAFASEGLTRLRIGLMQSGLDPKYFKWPPDHEPDRAPYRGLKPLEADDAGIFFGREGPTIVGLDILRGLRDAPPPRLLVILGASGAGKSSFMRAGLLPRLEREDQHFLPLPVIRPERAVVTGDSGLITCLEEALKAVGMTRSRSELREMASRGGAGIAPLLSALVGAKVREIGAEAGRMPPTIVIPIDQAEELFTADGAKEGAAFLALIHELSTKDAPAVVALFTVRSDNYEPLQTDPVLGSLRQHTFSLPPMPQGNYATVIQGPPARLTGTDRALVVEETLVQALLTDIEQGGGKDALPLLAFTLERLYLEFHGAGHLTQANYEQLGRIGGSIEAAVERAFEAADADPRVPRDRDARLALLRRGLIPWLAGIDPDIGAPRRSIARLSEIPAEAQPLIQHLVEQRLLATDVSKKTGETTIEPAHEALLRQWGLLQGWLVEDAGLLSVLDGIKRASRDWAANGKTSAWLAHGTQRLIAAQRLQARHDLAAKLEPTDKDYIAACQMAERVAQKKARRAKVLVGTLAACVIAVVGFSYAGILNQSYLKIQLRKLTDIHVPWMKSLLKIRDRNIAGIYIPTALTAEEEQALKPAGRFHECASCPEMVVIPAGNFEMGSGDGRDNERWTHRVTISKQYAVSRFSITFDEWDGCVAHGGCTYRPSDEGWGRGRRPVINVSLHHLKEYVAWLSKQTGNTYRLLSEAEWEYAARADSKSRYPWGNDIGKRNANCNGCESPWDNNQTAPVGEFKPNNFGLFDMQGNVWQWVEDCYHESYEGAPADGRAWTTDCKDENHRVLRGGSWRSSPDDLTSSYRYGYTIGFRPLFNIGFRIARTLTP
jgi:formylglycine-generating enzyme required for sulfatase activity